MKLKAVILICCLLVYILELITLPAYCGPSRQQESSCSVNTANACSKKATGSPCQKKQERTANGAADCCIVNCPLFYVTTLSEAATLNKAMGFVKRAYPHYQSNYLFLYYATAWKPPNRC